MGQDDSTPARRRRPATRNGRPTLTPELLAEAMLELAGTHGFRAVSMRALADHLGVTVRALYHNVRDRQEVVDRAAALFTDRLPRTDLDAEHWESSLADHCHALRDAYRRHPRALLLSLDEHISDAAAPVRRLEQTDAMLGMLRSVGLSVRDAVDVHRDLGIRVFGFVLLLDYRHDRGEDVMVDAPVPRAWLHAHPELDLPHLREAAASDAGDSVDDAFAALVANLLADVRVRAARR